MRICMLGIRRSGNSPIRNWINELFPGSQQLLNAAPAVTLDLEQFGDQDLVVSFEELPTQILDQVTCDKKVLILRDPFNLWASRIRHYDALSSGKRWINPEVTNLWPMYADAFLDPDPEIICINYNQFVTDAKYRRKLCRQLGGKFSDDSLAYVDDNGQGSSFDGTTYDGNAKDMPVFNRWEYYATIQAFRDLFTDDIVTKSDAIFGEGPWKTLYSS